MHGYEEEGGCGARFGGRRRALVPYFGGVRYEAHQDSVEAWAICYGHARRVYPGMGATREQCDAWLEEDIKIALDAVKRNVQVQLSAAEEVALGDFAFNLGETNLRKSTLLRLVNAGQHDIACDEYRRWVMTGGRKLDGLVRRQGVEEWLCQMH